MRARRLNQWRFSISLGVLAVFTVCAGYTLTSAVVLELGAYPDIPSARQVHLRAEKALEQIGFSRESISKSGQSLERNEDDRFVASYFRDPQSPQSPPSAWHAQVLLTKSGNLMQIILIQPGAAAPSELLKLRSADVASQLSLLMPTVEVKIKDGT